MEMKIGDVVMDIGSTPNEPRGRVGIIKGISKDVYPKYDIEWIFHPTNIQHRRYYTKLIKLNKKEYWFYTSNWSGTPLDDEKWRTNA